MSPTCLVKPKQSIYQQKSKPKYSKKISKQKTERSMTSIETKQQIDEYLYVELDIKCSCSQSKSNHQSSIQFSRRYLQCQSSMPIAILRSYIQQILPHSSMTQVSLFDSNDQLLQDSHLLHSLKNTTSSTHIPIRFTLLNMITSLSHCLCSSSSSSSSSSTEQKTSLSSCPTIIKRESIDQTLSTCSFIPPTSTSIYSPCLSSSSPSPTNELTNSISIVNLLTPPSSSSTSTSTSTSSCHSSFLIGNLVDSNQSIIDEITSQFGEICPPLPSSTRKTKPRNRLPKKVMSTHSPNVPLDLSLKKRSSPLDLCSSQTKWVKT